MRLAFVGDLLISRPLAGRAAAEPGFAQAVARLRAADVTFGNLETAICGLDAPDVVPWGVPEDWVVRADPEVGADLREVGFDLLGRGNNHSMDWGVGGLRETSRLLDAAGLVHAGAGVTRADAFAPAVIARDRHRVALVSATTSCSDHTPALDPFRGIVPARPGVAAIRVAVTVTAPADGHATLETLRAVYPEADSGWSTRPGDALELFRRRFVRGDRWSVEYEIDPDDRATVLDSIARARHSADVVVLALHVHQGDHDPAHPPPFLRALAASAIEAGAAAVVVSGPHRLGPVEVIAGRPVLYGLGNFVWSDVQDPLPGYYFDHARALIDRRFGGDAGSVGDAELVEALNEGVFDDAGIFRAVIAELVIDDSRTEVRLVPVELGFGRPLPERGVPSVATGDLATAILGRVDEISAPLGVRVDPAGEVRPV